MRKSLATLTSLTLFLIPSSSFAALPTKPVTLTKPLVTSQYFQGVGGSLLTAIATKSSIFLIGTSEIASGTQVEVISLSVTTGKVNWDLPIVTTGIDQIATSAAIDKLGNLLITGLANSASNTSPSPTPSTSSSSVLNPGGVVPSEVPPVRSDLTISMQWTVSTSGTLTSTKALPTPGKYIASKPYKAIDIKDGLYLWRWSGKSLTMSKVGSRTGKVYGTYKLNGTPTTVQFLAGVGLCVVIEVDENTTVYLLK